MCWTWRTLCGARPAIKNQPREQRKRNTLIRGRKGGVCMSALIRPTTKSLMEGELKLLMSPLADVSLHVAQRFVAPCQRLTKINCVHQSQWKKCFRWRVKESLGAVGSQEVCRVFSYFAINWDSKVWEDQTWELFLPNRFFLKSTKYLANPSTAITTTTLSNITNFFFQECS